MNMGEEEWEKYEDVLGPLMDANSLGPRFEGRRLFGEDAYRGDSGGAEGGAEGGGGVCDHGLAAVLEEREVGQGVADVGEVVSEALAEGG
jgi:hypothetical protein